MLILMGSGPGIRTVTVMRELIRSSRRRQFEQLLLLGDEDFPIEVMDRVFVISIIVSLAVG